MMEQQKKTLWNRNFILLWQGMAFSAFGDVLYSLAIGIWVYGETGSEAWMGIVSSISMFTSMILMPFAGTLIDRWNRRNILVVCDFLRGILMLGVAGIVFFADLTLEIVLITAFVAALCHVFFSPASMTMFADVVNPANLIRAQSLSSGTNSLITLIGRALSGTLVVFLGVGPIILINGISLLISSVTEIFIQIPSRPRHDEKISLNQIFRDMQEGLNYIIHHRGLAVIMIGALLGNLFSSGFFSMLLPYTVLKGMNLSQYGIFTSVFSLAGLIGTLMMGIVPIPPKKRVSLMFLSMIVGSLFSGFALTFLEGFILLCAAAFVSQLLNAIGNAILNASLVLVIEEKVRGRVLSIMMPCSMGGQAISAVAYGFLAESIGLLPILLMGHVISAILFIFLKMSPALNQTLEKGCVGGNLKLSSKNT